MHNTQDEFGTLRSLLQKKPTVMHFTAVFDHLLAHTKHEAFEEVWLPYAEDSLKTWPDGTRIIGHMPEGLAHLDFHEGITRLLRHLCFSRQDPSQIREIVQRPILSHITTVKFLGTNSSLIAEKVRAVLEGSPLANLANLAVSWQFDFKEDGCRALIDYLDQPRLDTLRLEQCGVGARALKVLLTHPQVLGLSALHLAENPLGSGGAKAFEKATGLAHLEKLDLCGFAKGKIKAQGFEALARSTHLKTLKSLNVTKQHIGDAGIDALLGAAHFARLDDLDVSFNQISGEALERLCRSPRSSKLSRLLVAGNFHTGDVTARTLATSTTLDHLKALDISYTSLGDEAFISLIESPVAQHLTTLRAYRNKLTNKSVEALLAADLPELTRVNLESSGIDRAHIKKLAQRYESVITV